MTPRGDLYHAALRLRAPCCRLRTCSPRRRLQAGADRTLASYGVEHPRELPAGDVAFLRTGRFHHEIDTHAFVHAGSYPNQPLADTPPGSFVGRFFPGATLHPGCSGSNRSLASTGPRSFEHEYAISTSSCGLAHFASGPVNSDALPRPSQFDRPATTNLRVLAPHRAGVTDQNNSAQNRPGCPHDPLSPE